MTRPKCKNESYLPITRKINPSWKCKNKRKRSQTTRYSTLLNACDASVLAFRRSGPSLDPQQLNMQPVVAAAVDGSPERGERTCLMMLLTAPNAVAVRTLWNFVRVPTRHSAHRGWQTAGKRGRRKRQSA